ncbi:hypothetical protein [Pseudomonas sp. BN102]|uniref:hypothetical protein n=1 Tax=Pseudomonas sp. BN102 TaxID=2567886 RepID=UPI002455BD4B|nr:hypothetical protein [Pseudomonas sp. BN102]MDH4608949.1 hypothetical protein [Pseudomonas sp. BN102]
MYRKYFVVCEDLEGFPCREEFIEKAWGDLPVSFFQDDEFLSKASYLDVKVNKWEVSQEWSTLQEVEPCIRIDFLRDERLAEFCREVRLSGCEVSSAEVVLVLELDGEGMELDELLLASMVRVLSETYQCYALDELPMLLDGKFFLVVPSREDLMAALLIKGG